MSKSRTNIPNRVKGARTSTGPYGTYIRIDSTGIHYRRKVDGTVIDHEPISRINVNSRSESADESIHTKKTNQFIDSSKKDLITDINARLHKPTFARKVFIIATLIASAIASLSLVVQSQAIVLEKDYPIFFALPLVTAAAVLGIGIYLTWVTSKQDQLAKTTTLKYELDNEASRKFTEMQTALANFAKSQYIWQVTSQTANWDWKRNAGATSLMTRRRIGIMHKPPPFISTQTTPYSISINSMQIYFFPDQILVYQNGQYRTVDYNSFQISVAPTRYIESQSVPGDAIVVDYTWQYVRKDGGPDLRFVNNRQIPITQYGRIEFSSHPDINFLLHVSNLSVAQQFGQIFLTYSQNYQKHQDSSSRSSSSNRQHASDHQRTKQSQTSTKGKSPYEILGVAPNASEHEINIAYRKMAQMYHPDKVAGLAPEYNEIAEKQMKAINAAYEELNRKFKA